MNPERWQQIEPILHAALERESSQRAAFLDEACAGDAELRREVESLLVYQTRAEDFIEAPAIAVAARQIAREPAHITVGATLGHYQILSLLGKGGMGEVYRARDSRLSREVAIKVLPAAFSHDAERLRRFEQEARAAGMLNHPNILVVHDIGTQDGAPYIVSELLEGETLHARLNGSALPSRKAIEYALQIARGLAAAHEKGIVHRDLKPENLFLTKDGRIKILDFGLAKLKPRTLSVGVDSQASTIAPPTTPGVVMGTVGYMSPEQASGEEADHRADIFSFGAILYEMLTGQRAFQGKTAVEVLNAILKEEPAGLAESAEAERHFALGPERVLRRCLAKNPEERFQSASDLAFAIESLAPDSHSDSRLSTASGGRLSAIAARFTRRERPWWIAATVLLLAASLALAWLYFRRAPTAAGAIRFSILPPEKTAFLLLHQRNDVPYSQAVSPDGQRLALITVAEGRTRLWVRPLSSLTAQPLEGTEGAGYPFWSPDSRYIGFFADGMLKKIEATGGPAQTLCNAPQWGTTATWNSEDVVLFSMGHEGIFRVSAVGGEPALMIKPKPLFPISPHFLPDGRHFLFTALGESAIDNDLYVGSLDSGESAFLVRDASRAVYAPGYLLYVRDGTLLAHPFDERLLRVLGEPLPLAEQIWYFWPLGSADFSVSRNGVLAYRSGAGSSRLAWFDRRGVEVGPVGATKDHEFPRISPDGQSLAVNVTDPRTGTTDVWIYDLTRGAATRFTFEPGVENTPIWSPDGRRIVFAADRHGPPNLYQKSLHETSGGEALVPMSGWVQWSYDWTRDGRFIIYGDGEAKTGEDLMLLPMFGERKPAPFLRTQFNEVDARFSPDGRWIAYVSDESGRSEVYVRSFPSAGPGAGQEVKRQISAGGGASPRWRRDGKELFYLAADQRLIAVPVRAGTGFETGAPASLFRVETRDNQYDVAADGQRFLINVSLVEARLLPITVVVNWTAELNRTGQPASSPR